MAPPVPAATARRGSEFTPRNETDIISRLHSEALDTPTSLSGRLGISKTNHARAKPDYSSSDSDAESSQQNRGRKPKHSRSMSNPFPSLFSSRKRQGSASKPSVDVDKANVGPAPNKQVNTHRRGSPTRSRDFATGNCMTCASLVKWPKDLKVFKLLIVKARDSAMTEAQDHQRQDNRQCLRGYHQSKAPGRVLLGILLCPSLSTKPSIWPGKICDPMSSGGFATCQMRLQLSRLAMIGLHTKIDSIRILPPSQMEVDSPIFDLDPKLLLLGDVAENGLWWTGQDTLAPKKPPTKEEPAHIHRPPPLTKSPQLNWTDIDEWYSIVNNAAEGWFTIFEEVSGDLSLGQLAEQELLAIEQDVLKGQAHLQRVLLKVTENLLKRPGRPIKDPMDLRFLLIAMENPSLYAENENFHGVLQLENQMVTWLARYHAPRFIKVKELVSGFLTYRMIRQSEKKQADQSVDLTAGLIPQMQSGRHGGASLHDAIGGPRPTKKPKEPIKKISYSDDWQIKAASRVLSLLFSANNVLPTRRGEDAHPNGTVTWNGTGRVAGYFLPPTDFYNSMIDYADLVEDFESWESRRSKFSFCQYPFLLSIWAKTHILEHDARRQMQSKARDAFFDSIMTRRNINQYLFLDVRRDCLVDDSLTAVSSVIGSGGEDLKKGLRISFQGEEGIDAGGLRKEWFLLLIREVFNPDYGMFIYDDDSQYCYFNPNSFEPSDQFFLVGVVMGLAIYNSTILDVALPPFAFRKLLASAPSLAGTIPQQHKPVMRYTLDDLSEYRPRLANGLRQLLAFDGDVEETFCLDFVIETDKYGSKIQVPLCPGGENKPVTNENRREYVDLYVRYVLDTAVKRQFEPFKRGFYTVCGGNAFSLFRPEEIELLIRGSDESLDIASLRAVAEYDNWESKTPDETEPVVGWFWDTFQQATPSDQRKLLTFITGSDRIPAMGAASLAIKLSCLGDDCGRYPIARTCFNMLSLWRYESKERLESMLWRAVHESEGFGLK
ncbi:probable E3 ubiquitin-protein ligase mug30 [Trichoderma asperellum]|uniref:HECT-type E3 ubiquitin transferase n=1 Tax=Trichoderma asperellum TaxID=101201 RepID=A0A6V8QPN0_TRIAP|nr:probable E3 ubiquitin-protein ligase mug30 [Trichoderma asperellum]